MSDSGIVDKATWIVELPDNTREWRERISGGYQVVKIEPPPAPIGHIHSDLVTDTELAAAIAAHAALPNAHHPANVGVTGTKTLGGFKFTFTNGLLTGFEPA